jgi:branched-chain amino acid transport system ATP-binding protein
LLLEVHRINAYYGLSHILFDVSLNTDRGEIVVLLGRNGAGKTTTFRSIMGLTPIKTGKILFRGEDISKKPTYKISLSGMGFVPEDRRIYSELTVRENLEIGSRRGATKSTEWTIDLIYELFPILKKFQKRRGETLSGGEQQMLTIGRTLMGNPELLLLDEPTEGLAPLIVKMMRDLMLRLKTEGLTVLLSEQNVRFAIHVGDRAYIIDNGKIEYEDQMKNLDVNEEIKKKYLAV